MIQIDIACPAVKNKNGKFKTKTNIDWMKCDFNGCSFLLGVFAVRFDAAKLRHARILMFIIIQYEFEERIKCTFMQLLRFFMISKFLLPKTLQICIISFVISFDINSSFKSRVNLILEYWTMFILKKSFRPDIQSKQEIRSPINIFTIVFALIKLFVQWQSDMYGSGKMFVFYSMVHVLFISGWLLISISRSIFTVLNLSLFSSIKN